MSIHSNYKSMDEYKKAQEMAAKIVMDDAANEWPDTLADMGKFSGFRQKMPDVADSLQRIGSIAAGTLPVGAGLYRQAALARPDIIINGHNTSLKSQLHQILEVLECYRHVQMNKMAELPSEEYTRKKAALDRTRELRNELRSEIIHLYVDLRDAISYSFNSDRDPSVQVPVPDDLFNAYALLGCWGDIVKNAIEAEPERALALKAEYDKASGNVFEKSKYGDFYTRGYKDFVFDVLSHAAEMEKQHVIEQEKAFTVENEKDRSFFSGFKKERRDRITK